MASYHDYSLARYLLWFEQTLMLLIGTSGAILWAARIPLDTPAPVHQWAREIRQATIDRRQEAALRLRVVTPGELGVAVLAPAAALRDDDEPAVVAAAESLGQAGQASVRALAAHSLGQFRAGRDAARFALLLALGSNEPQVRTACDEALENLQFGKDERRSVAPVPTLIDALAGHGAAPGTTMPPSWARAVRGR